VAVADNGSRPSAQWWRDSNAGKSVVPDPVPTTVGRQASSAFLPIPGPNGPHGSKFTHILERRYEASQAAQPGQPVLNLFPNPDLSAVGPYPLCGKCHDLKLILANTSFSEHARHIRLDSRARRVTRRMGSAVTPVLFQASGW
jgi:hypothetical protein